MKDRECSGKDGDEGMWMLGYFGEWQNPSVSGALKS